MRTVFHRLLRLLAAGAVALAGASIAHATSVTAISNNINGMRQLTSQNIVQQYPGDAPYFGPSICEQVLPSYQAKMGTGYACTCPQGADSPVCVPECSVLLPSYQQKAGMQSVCSCPSANAIPTCRAATCAEMLPYYAAQYPSPAFTCGCPWGATSQQAPSCRANPTCAQMLPSMQAAYGGNYACACPACTSTQDQNCYVGPSCTPIVKACTFNLSNTTLYNTTWSCSGTQSGNNISYSCTDSKSGAISAGSAIQNPYVYNGWLAPGQCQTWAVPWISCTTWPGIAPPNGCTAPNSCACGLPGTWACSYNYNPYGTTGGSWMNSVADNLCGGANRSRWGIAFNVVCWNGNQLNFTAADSQVFSSACLP